MSAHAHASAKDSSAMPSPKPASSYLLQRKCECGGSSGLAGQCESCSSKKRFGLQTKLKVGEPGDIYEREADRIADQVMAMPAHHAVSSGPPRIQRFSGQSNGQIGAAPARVDHALSSSGTPLELALRQDMEQRFGHDFSRVRVHSGAAPEQSARDVNAHAYTVGHDIVFGAGQFAPRTHDGRKLLAHELTHVVQGSGPEPTDPLQEPTNTGEEIVAAPIFSSPVTVRRSPDNEKSCGISETILVYEGRPGEERCIIENDPEFSQNYVDNNIVLSTGLAIPDTTWENIDHDRIPQMKLTYKDGSTLVLDVKDIPLVLGSSRVARGPRAVSASRPLARYEKRSDGFIYPIRSEGHTDYVSYGDASNIVSLRAGLHDEIEELKIGFQLIEAGASFGGDIAMLGGIAAMLGHPGGLFEPIPKKRTGVPAAEEPTGPKTAREPAREQEHPTGKPSQEHAPASARKTPLAEIPAEGEHTVRVSKGGIVEFCTDCVNIGLVYRETLEQNPELAKSFRDIQIRARQAEEMIESGNQTLKAQGETQAKKAAADALRLQSKLAKTGITRNGTRFRPEPDLLASGRHGLGWTDEDAIARAKDTGNPQGRFGGLEDIQFAAEQAAQLGPGGESVAPYIKLPANTRSVVFLSNGGQRPATHLYVKVRSNGSFHAYPL
jgi:hypothetical protein